MKKNKNRILAVITAVVVTASSFPGAASAENSTAYVTRGQALNIILEAAKDYNPGVKKEDILKGYGDGTLQEDRMSTRLEAAVMVGRGFGQLPEPKGDSLRTGVFHGNYMDVPPWAKEDIEGLKKAGVLAGIGGNRLGTDENITREELNRIIQRIWALEGSNLKDDFYAAVNKGWLENSEIPAGEATNGTLEIMAHENDVKIEKILQELLQEDHTKGSKEQKISDFYKSALDMQNRNRQGIEPIRKYLEAYAQAGSLEQLLRADIGVEAGTGRSQLLGFGIYPDPKDSGSNILYHAGLVPTMEKDIYRSKDDGKGGAYIKYMTRLLVLAGENEKTAAVDAEKMFELEKELSAAELRPQEKQDVDKTYNSYTLAELDALYPALDMKKVLKALGYKTPDKILVEDKKLLEKSAEYFSESNLEVLKIYAKLKFLFAFSKTLSEDFGKAAEDFNARVYGVEGAKTVEERAALAVQDTLPDYLGEIYVKRNFLPEAKKDVETMVGEFIGIYQNKIESLDWMEEKTKQKAIKKLETLKVKVGYPDRWPDKLKKAEIKSYEKGGSYFENLCAIRRTLAARNKRRQGMRADRSAWEAPAYMVNAYYNALNNEIVFPAGILQAPLYDVRAPKERNYGAIGVVIAHEISHAFDNNGSKFDEKGNAAEWWTEEDYKRFEEKCREIEAFYDGIEIAPGIVSSGTLTLSENIADLGGISCSLQAVSRLERPDYRAFFGAYAGLWKETASRKILEYMSTGDVHSYTKIRVNRSVVNFEEFYEAFGITEEDGMYVAPEKRVKLW